MGKSRVVGTRNQIRAMRGVIVAYVCMVMMFSSSTSLAQQTPDKETTTAKTFTFDDVLQLLDSSEKRFSYLGTKFIIDYTPTRRSTTLVKVTYGAGLEKKEVSPLQNGEPQIILDDGKYLWHYIPSQASVIKKKQQLSLGKISQRIYSQNKLIQENYSIRIEQQDLAAIMPPIPQVPSVMGNVMVMFEPKHHDRPTWKLLIESEHGLIVRTEVYDVAGNLALLSAFSELTFQPKLSEKSFVVTVPKGTKMETSVENHFRTIEEAQAQASFSIVAPTYLPPGFILNGIISSPTERGEKVQFSYIDGMSTISIFEEKQATEVDASLGITKEVDINSSIKGTFYDHGLIKILRWALDAERIVTLVGEVSDSELVKIAASIIAN
ncbi:hypothetical protein U14_04970 [Candidatus Moduliflexus flocculans]|uniref:DUF4367 domain-containing protein n=1 Tax=Candidatus Moduliflexus flocculans TaxID=1499966 RepID=A0A081BQL8_9BACT|nr:hypothetical protein U14_04970 [Candidatus Moduliflexus flocculans]